MSDKTGQEESILARSGQTEKKRHQHPISYLFICQKKWFSCVLVFSHITTFVGCATQSCGYVLVSIVLLPRRLAFTMVKGQGTLFSG